MPTTQIIGWREHKNRTTYKRIALFFESLAVIIIFVGITATLLGLF
jgi:hypothetical protein